MTTAAPLARYGAMEMARVASGFRYRTRATPRSGTRPEPGVSVSEVGRAAGLHVSQLFRWRKQLCMRIETPVATRAMRDEPSLVPVTIVPTPAAKEPPPRRRRRPSGVIEIEMSGGGRVRVGDDVDAGALRRVLDVLEGR